MFEFARCNGHAGGMQSAELPVLGRNAP